MTADNFLSNNMTKTQKRKKKESDSSKNVKNVMWDKFLKAVKRGFHQNKAICRLTPLFDHMFCLVQKKGLPNELPWYFRRFISQCASKPQCYAVYEWVNTML